MENKLEELTDRLYKEGVEKANKEAEKVLSDAKKKADEIVKEAQQNAEEIEKKAQAEADDLKKRVETEVRQASLQTIRSLKQDITGMVTMKAVQGPVKESFNDTEFVKKIIEAAISNWSPEKGNATLELLLPEKEKEVLEEYFQKNTSKILSDGLTIKSDPSMKAGFKLGPADGSYKISFEEEDFENLFKTYLRPKTVEMLFGKE